MTIDETVQLAYDHHRAGRLAEAETLYRQVLAQQPDHAYALHKLGTLAGQKGEFSTAVDLIRQALRLTPDHARAHYNLGVALQGMGRIEESIASYRRAISLKPDDADAHHMLGIALRRAGSIEEAIASYRQAIRLKPDYAEAHYNLANALKEIGQLDQAVNSYRQAIGLKPDLVEAHINLGAALRGIGQLNEAVASYRQALRIRPDYADTHNNLGVVFKGLGRLDEAIASCRRAIELRPDYADAHSNLGNALKDAGELDDAIAAYRRAVALKPESAAVHSNLLYALHFHPAYDAGMIHEEQRRWNQQHAEPLRKFIQPHPNSRDADRPLRIGYVSPDFREHAVGRFLLPLLAAHDPHGFVVHCYADVPRPDHWTALLRRHAGQWRSTVGLADERLAQLIRDDQIDILVDLTMHMGGNRMLLFARKPAPVQATYLAYCSTTGLATMDYRLTDPHLDPPGTNDALYCERSMRLPQTYWCYPPNEASVEVSPPPALGAGEMTFGSLNNFCKVSSDALNLWIELLRATPKSRLILHAHEGSHRRRVWDALERQGIDPRRLKFVGAVSLSEYFRLYEQIDVGLDPFPCNGGTTTCDALWMGVPVVTLSGRTAVGRGGASILANVGLPELIARGPDHFMEIAGGFAGDIPRLAELRRTLRARMQASPLMDAARFARDVEAAYRRMWRDWCERT